jgi:hypothetical protein
MGKPDPMPGFTAMMEGWVEWRRGLSIMEVRTMRRLSSTVLWPSVGPKNSSPPAVRKWILRSHLIYPKMEHNTGVGSRQSEKGIKPGEVAWPTGAKSAVVIAVEHPEETPALDWWYGKKSPPGNRILMRSYIALHKWV